MTRLACRRRLFTVRLDGGPPLARLARSVVIGNVGLLPGGFALLPDARLDDGLLDVGILAPAGLPGWGLVARRVVTGSRHDNPNLERYRARRVEIRRLPSCRARWTGRSSPRAVPHGHGAAGRAAGPGARPVS